MVFNTGKIAVTASSRALARRCFMDAIAKVRTCMAIQVGKKRPAISPVVLVDAKQPRLGDAASVSQSGLGQSIATTEAVKTGAEDSDDDDDEEELVDA
mmetsp:Transcript_2983/g.4269  ORF Transcript_2983/g.4269 Transcript_2983/m.4269 type:complete len:98 (+) Transcript_2983:65-358(+)